MRPADLYRLRTVTDVAVSPDGRTAAYVVERVDSGRDRYAHDLWTVPAAGGTPRRLTRLESGVMASPAFSPDGRRIAFLANRRGGAPQLWVADLDGDARQITRLRHGADEPAWSPAGDRIAFVSAVPATHRGSRSPEGEAWRQVHTIAARAGARPFRVTSAPWHHGSPAWTPDGRALLLSSAMPRGGVPADRERAPDLLLVPLDGRPTRRLVEPGRAETSARYSPDGRFIAYVRQHVDTTVYSALDNELVVMRADGTGRRSVSGPLDRPVGSFAFAPDGSLLFTVASGGAVSLYRTMPDSVAPRAVVSGPRGVLDFAAGGGRVVWAQTEPGRPSEVHAAGQDGSGERRLTALNDSLLSRRRLAAYEEIRYRSFDGHEVQGWVLRPPDRPARTAPLAVVVHGGPHLMWGPGEASSWLELQSLAGAGYTVFFCNPRGSAGYGAAGMQSIRRDWAASPARDVLAGADSVLGRGLADRARQVVTGASYGGYLTAWLVAREAPDRFRAAVVQRAAFDLERWHRESDAGWLFEAEFGGPPTQVPGLARAQSPMTYVARVRTPVLILHGEVDVRTPIAGAEAFHAALRRQGTPAALVRYPREGHELTRSGEPAHRIDHMRRVVEWFGRYAGR